MNVLKGLLLAVSVAALVSTGYVVGVWFATIPRKERTVWDITFDDEDQDAIG